MAKIDNASAIPSQPTTLGRGAELSKEAAALEDRVAEMPKPSRTAEVSLAITDQGQTRHLQTLRIPKSIIDRLDSIDEKLMLKMQSCAFLLRIAFFVVLFPLIHVLASSRGAQLEMFDGSTSQTCYVVMKETDAWKPIDPVGDGKKYGPGVIWEGAGPKLKTPCDGWFVNDTALGQFFPLMEDASQEQSCQAGHECEIYVKKMSPDLRFWLEQLLVPQDVSIPDLVVGYTAQGSVNNGGLLMISGFAAISFGILMALQFFRLWSKWKAYGRAEEAFRQEKENRRDFSGAETVATAEAKKKALRYDQLKVEKLFMTKEMEGKLSVERLFRTQENEEGTTVCCVRESEEGNYVYNKMIFGMLFWLLSFGPGTLMTPITSFRSSEELLYTKFTANAVFGTVGFAGAAGVLLAILNSLLWCLAKHPKKKTCVAISLLLLFSLMALAQIWECLNQGFQWIDPRFVLEFTFLWTPALGVDLAQVLIGSATMVDIFVVMLSYARPCLQTQIDTEQDVEQGNARADEVWQQRQNEQVQVPV